MSFSDALTALSGLAIFLYGMEVMGSGFKHMAGSKLQEFLEKLTKKPLVALLSGLLVTALIQSSSATTSMLVSFVNAGIMRVSQTFYVILGTNIGTTVTGHLMALDVGLVAPFMAFIGVCLIMFFNEDKTNAVGEIMMGLGFVFIGMDTMSSGLEPLGSSPFFIETIVKMQNPIVGILVGFALTAMVQSSSASLGIIQSLAKGGLVTIQDVLFFNLGQKIGTCTTALLASLSFNRDAKRVAIINLSFNIASAVLFTVLYLLLPIDRLYMAMAPGNVVEQIAIMHTFTAVVSAIVFFSCAELFTRIAYAIIPDHGTKKELQPEVVQAARIEDNVIFNIFGINVEISNMFEIVKQSIYIGFNGLLEHTSVIDAVSRNEDQVNLINRGISRNLMLLMASNVNMQESRQAASLFSINVDLERMSDHALNVAEAEEDLISADSPLSVEAYDELSALADVVMNSLSTIDDMISTGDASLIEIIRKNEDIIDEMCANNRDAEISRMKDNEDVARPGITYCELLIDIERIGDHMMNVAESLSASYEGQ